MKKRILVTGGTGRFGTVLKKLKTNYEMFFPNKKTLDVTDFRSIQKYIKLKKTKYPYSSCWIIQTDEYSRS